MVCWYVVSSVEEERGSQAKKFGEKGMNFAKKSYVEWKKSDCKFESAAKYLT